MVTRRAYRLTPGIVTAAFSSGVKPVFRLRFSSGRTVDASANHPFLSLGGWVRVEDLEVGAHLATGRRLPEVETEPSMPDEELAHGVQDLLARLDIRSRLRTVPGRHGRTQYHVEVSGRDEQILFAEIVGIHGGRAVKLDERTERNRQLTSNPNVDIIPKEVWDHVRQKSLAEAGMTARDLAAALGMSYCGSALYKSGCSGNVCSGWRLQRVIRGWPTSSRVM